MRHQYDVQSEPSHMRLAQSVFLSRRRQLFGGSCLVGHHVASTFLHPFAPPALPGFLATMGALTPGRPALRILIRDNERRPGNRSGLLVSCIKPSRRSASNHPVAASGVWSGFDSEPTAQPAGCIPFSGPWRRLGFTMDSRLAATTGRIEFVILRTSGSLPVALHPLSRGRSYFQLQRSDPTLTGTCTLLIRYTHKRTIRHTPCAVGRHTECA
jgi:hypothetical protein